MRTAAVVESQPAGNKYVGVGRNNRWHALTLIISNANNGEARNFRPGEFALRPSN